MDVTIRRVFLALLGKSGGRRPVFLRTCLAPSSRPAVRFIALMPG